MAASAGGRPAVIFLTRSSISGRLRASSLTCTGRSCNSRGEFDASPKVVGLGGTQQSLACRQTPRGELRVRRDATLLCRPQDGLKQFHAKRRVFVRLFPEVGRQTAMDLAQVRIADDVVDV